MYSILYIQKFILYCTCRVIIRDVRYMRTQLHERCISAQTGRGAVRTCVARCSARAPNAWSSCARSSRLSALASSRRPRAPPIRTKWSRCVCPQLRPQYPPSSHFLVAYSTFCPSLRRCTRRSSTCSALRSRRSSRNSTAKPPTTSFDSLESVLFNLLRVA